MTAILAAIPLAAVLVAMGALHLSAALAGAIGLGMAALIALIVFDLAAAAPGGLSAAALGTAAEALHSTGAILWIILPALALFEYQERSGAIGRIRTALTGLTEDRRLQAILIAWFFGLFIEGAAGFGAPVALAAPLLAGLGYAPVRAVALALLGHAAGVSFGAVGTPTLAQIELSGLSPTTLAGTVAAMQAAAGGVLMLAMVRMAGDRPLTRADLGWAGLAMVCFFVPALGFAWFAGPELASLGGALVGAVAFIALLRRAEPGPLPPLKTLLPDLAPYLAILALVLITRLVGPLTETLRGVALAWALPEAFSGRFEPLYHPGTLLFAGLAIAALVTGRLTPLGSSIGPALARLLPVAAALLMMLSLSRLMVHSGMIDALAAGAAGAGAAWPMLAPWVGILGTFITGSATTSNILFTEFQIATATTLSLSPLALVAVQGFGSAVGNVVAPHNIIAGSATVGLVGKEGTVLRKTLLPAAIAALIGGAIALWLGAALA
ncbi:MAG: L-lactate permease [Pseudomonadota bacterium]